MDPNLSGWVGRNLSGWVMNGSTFCKEKYLYIINFTYVWIGLWACMHEHMYLLGLHFGL